MAPTMSETDLRAPLLDVRRVAIEVRVLSQEWCPEVEDGANFSSGEEDAAVLPARHERYRRMARDIAEASSSSWGQPLHARQNTPLDYVDLDKLRCASAVLFFTEVLLSATTMFLLAFVERNWIAIAFLAPSQLLVLGLEIYLARTDRSVTLSRQKLRGASRWWRMAFEVYVIGGLGCCFLYTLIRARRYWKSKASRRTFLMELEAQDPTRRDLADHARFDSHAMFVSSVPRVVVLVCLLASHQYKRFEEAVFVTTLVLSSIVVVQAVVNFDYHASRHIRRQYALSTFLRFQAEHILYRLSEVLGRALVFVAGALAAHLYPAAVTAVACLDYLLGVCALRCVSRASKKAWMLGIPLLVADVGRYADEDGFALPAHRLSRWLFAVRLPGMLAAVLVYAYVIEHPCTAAKLPLEGTVAVNLLVCTLLANSLYFILGKFSQVSRVGDDLFTATLRGDAETVATLLDTGCCDANVRLGDQSLQTALHMAASSGHVNCARELLRRGADLAIVDSSGENPLHAACLGDDYYMADLLVRNCLSSAAQGGGGVGIGDGMDTLSRCLQQKNHLGQTPAQVNPDAPMEIRQLLADTAKMQQQAQVDAVATEMPQAPPVESCDPHELHELFGPLVGGEHYRFRAKPKAPGRSRAEGLTSFLFSKGVGEQLAEVLDSLNERAAGNKICLSDLKTMGTLGAGGFGKVIKVQDARTGEQYAMKLQRKDKTTKCAVREARALHMSNHLFIVRLVHIFQTRSFYCLLMELCEKNLNARILEHTDGVSNRALGLPDLIVARYTTCIMLALEYLHGKYLVFRDLKPENVLITAESAGNYAKITDFGLARRVDLGSSDAVYLQVNGGNVSPSSVAKVVGERVAGESEIFDDFQPPSAQWRNLYTSPPVGTPGFMASEVLSASVLVRNDGNAGRGLPLGEAAGEGRRGGLFHAGSIDQLMRWEAGRDWYALGCCLFLMLLGERGGTRVNVSGRDVLLPPTEGNQILEEIHAAQRAGFVQADAVQLVASLTEPRVDIRGASKEMRQNRFLWDAIEELEAAAACASSRMDSPTSPALPPEEPARVSYSSSTWDRDESATHLVGDSDDASGWRMVVASPDNGQHSI